MYSPERNAIEQDGGAYISTFYDPSSLVTPVVTPSTLSTLLYFANLSSFNISSFAQISQLTIDQINALIRAVQQQIGIENQAITDNSAQIQTIQTSIDRHPDGLQDTYNLVSEQYQSVLRAYGNASSIQYQDSINLQQQIDYMKSLSSLSTVYGSSIKGYQDAYSTLYKEISFDNAVIAIEESTFQGLTQAYTYNLSTYQDALFNYNSSVYALSTNSTFLSVASYQYWSVSRVYDEDVKQFTWLSSQASIAQVYYLSTQSYLDYLNRLSSLQTQWYLSTNDALTLASTNLRAAQATVDYRNALNDELNAIAAYNSYYDQLIALENLTGTAVYVPQMANIVPVQWNTATLVNTTVNADTSVKPTTGGQQQFAITPQLTIPFSLTFTLPTNARASAGKTTYFGLTNTNSSAVPTLAYFMINDAGQLSYGPVYGSTAVAGASSTEVLASGTLPANKIVLTYDGNALEFTYNSKIYLLPQIGEKVTYATIQIFSDTTDSYKMEYSNQANVDYTLGRMTGGGNTEDEYIQEGGAANASQMQQLISLSSLVGKLSVMMWQSTMKRQEKERNQSTIEAVTLKSILDKADADITNAQNDVDTDRAILASTMIAMSSLSTQIGVDLQIMGYDWSTLTGLSSLQVYDQSTYNHLSDIIHGYDVIETLLSSCYRSTLFSLSNLLAQSTQFNQSISFYTQRYYLFSSIEAVAQFSVNTYSTAIGYNQSSIDGYGRYAGQLNGLINSDFDTLNSQAAQFYSQKMDQLTNELNEFKYAVQEWNSFTGYVTSELLIYKLNLYTQIDSLTFDLQQNPQSPTDFTNRKALTDAQGTIQSIVDALNPLDTYFGSIISNIDSELTNKTIFINTRSTLTAYEIQALQISSLILSAEFQAMYKGKFDELLRKVVYDIEPQIANRNNSYNNNINSVLNVNLPAVANLQILGQNVFTYIIRPEVIDTTIVTFTSRKNEFVLLSTLAVGLDPTTYNSVLGIP